MDIKLLFEDGSDYYTQFYTFYSLRSRTTKTSCLVQNKKAAGSPGWRGLTLCFCSSVRTSLRTFAHGISSGHQMGLQLSLPQPGFPRPVEYFSISGINARSWAWKTSTVISSHERHPGYVCVSQQILRL